ncbi:MAG: hypothetical protein EOP53_16050 [Sphingobacteriales bacterium]|nr:MAG: hypothetical protein EOP53_16050 [Sphingobacteriales bacterium]
MPLDERFVQELYDESIAELRASKDDDIFILTTRPQLMQIIAQLQLAFRHPANIGASATEVLGFIEAASADVFRNMPACKELIRLGFDLKEDNNEKWETPFVKGFKDDLNTEETDAKS